MQHLYKARWQVDLSNNELGAEGAKPLADALRVSASLTKVSQIRKVLGIRI